MKLKEVAPEGFVPVYRRFERRWRRKEVYEPEDAMFDVFSWQAAYIPMTKKVKGVTVHLRRGEALLSIGLCQALWDWNREKARYWIKAWEAEGFIERVREEGNAGTVYRLPEYPREGAGIYPTPGPTPSPIPDPTPKSSNGVGFQATNPTPDPTLHTTPDPTLYKNKNFKNKETAPLTPQGEQQLAQLGDVDQDEGSEPTRSKPQARGSSRTARFPKPKKGSMTYPPEFEEFWAAYPARKGANPKKGAYRRWRGLVVDDVPVADLLKAATGYASEQRREGKESTIYVMQAPRFLGPDAPWEEYVDCDTDSRHIKRDDVSSSIQDADAAAEARLKAMGF